MAAIGQKKASSHSLAVTRDTCNWNNRSRVHNRRSSPGQAELIVQCVCKNSTTRILILRQRLVQ